MNAVVSAADAVAAIWAAGQLPTTSLSRLHLSGDEPALPSSFAVGTAAQACLAAAALAATEIGRRRNGLVQDVTIAMREAALECCGAFTVDGQKPVVWDPIAGLYACRGGAANDWVRLHANFAHHRDGVLRFAASRPGSGIRNMPPWRRCR